MTAYCLDCHQPNVKVSHVVMDLLMAGIELSYGKSIFIIFVMAVSFVILPAGSLD